MKEFPPNTQRTFAYYSKQHSILSLYATESITEKFKLLKRNIVWTLEDNCQKQFPGGAEAFLLWWATDWSASKVSAEFFPLLRNKFNLSTVLWNKAFPALQIFLQFISLPHPAKLYWIPSWRFRQFVYLPHSIYLILFYSMTLYHEYSQCLLDENHNVSRSSTYLYYYLPITPNHFPYEFQMTIWSFF